MLNQFAKTLKLADEKNVPLYARTADQLMEKRKMIRTLIERLHIPAKCGKSLYELMRILEKYQDAPDSVHFDIPTAMLASEEDLADWERQLEILKHTVASLGTIPSQHPLQQIRTKEFKRHEKQQLRQEMQQWFSCMAHLREDVAGMKQKVGIADCDTVNFKVYISLADILSHAVIYPEYMAELLDKDHSFEDIELAYEKTAAIQEVLRTVDSLYDREIFSEDLAYEKKKLQIAGNGDGRLARMQRSGVLRMLRKYAKDPEQVTVENLPEQLEQLMALQEQYHDVGKLSALETEVLKNGSKIDWTLWQKADRRMKLVMDRLDTLAIDEESYGILQNYIEEEALAPDETFRSDRLFYKKIANQYLGLKQCTENIMQMADYDHDGRKDNISEIMLSDAWE